VAIDVRHSAPAETSAHGTRAAKVVSAIGPLTVLAGVIWALLQPYRITLLDPHGQGLWWLAVQPPLLVVAVGVAFHLVVARPLLEDLEANGG